MHSVLLFLLKIILSAIAAFIGYRFLRFMVDKLSAGHATKRFDNIQNKISLGKMGGFLIVFLGLVLINILGYLSH